MSLRDRLSKALGQSRTTRPNVRSVEAVLRWRCGLSKREANRAIHTGFADLHEHLTPAECDEIERLAAALRQRTPGPDPLLHAEDLPPSTDL